MLHARGALAVLFVLAAGCVNARDAFDDFGDRVPDAQPPPPDAGIVSNLPDITGEFYMVARPPLDEDRFFHFRSTFTFRSLTANTGELDWSGQALDFDTLEPVGEPFVATDVPVAATGIARIPMLGTLDGRANSVSQSDAEVNAEVEAHLITPNFVCGGLTGDAAGFPLAGTTVGGVRINGPGLPEMIIRCEDGPQP